MVLKAYNDYRVDEVGDTTVEVDVENFEMDRSM